MSDEQSNRKFSEANNEFIEACKAVDLKPGKRQASKWRNKKGLAWKRRFTSEGKI